MEHVRRVQRDGITFTVQGPVKCTPERSYYHYIIRDHGQVIAQGDDFSPSPLICPDSNRAMADLIGLFTYGIHDSSDTYTPEELQWVKAHQDFLDIWITDLEERSND
jgi:endo-1,4-beta-mannosidase